MIPSCLNPVKGCVAAQLKLALSKQLMQVLLLLLLLHIVLYLWPVLDAFVLVHSVLLWRPITPILHANISNGGCCYAPTLLGASSSVGGGMLPFRISSKVPLSFITAACLWKC